MNYCTEKSDKVLEEVRKEKGYSEEKLSKALGKGFYRRLILIGFLFHIMYVQLIRQSIFML